MTLDTLMASPLNKYRGEGVGGHEERKELPFEDFAEELKVYESLKPYTRGKENDEFFRQAITSAPDPQKINSLFQALRAHEEIYKGYCQNAGRFISRIIQNSYEAGYNNFTLNNTTAIWDIGEKLKGTQENPIKITIQDGAGHNLFLGAEHLEAHVYGSIANLVLFAAKNCTIHIHDDNEQLDLCCAAENCQAHVYGKARWPIIGSGCFAETPCGNRIKPVTPTTFYFHDKETFKAARNEIRGPLINRMLLALLKRFRDMSEFVEYNPGTTLHYVKNGKTKRTYQYEP